MGGSQVPFTVSILSEGFVFSTYQALVAGHLEVKNYNLKKKKTIDETKWVYYFPYMASNNCDGQFSAYVWDQS